MIHPQCCAPNDVGAILGWASQVAADAKPITEAEKKHCASAYHQIRQTL
jgi:hypothetical protein